MASPMLKRTIFSNKSLTVESFMYLPSPAVKNDVYDFTMYPIVNFRYTPQKGEFISDTKLMSFKMTPRNHWKVLNFFNTMARWMLDFKDLFLYDDKNELIFNYDYKDLKELVKSNYTESLIMKAAPAVLTFNENKIPGVCLYINKENQMCQLTDDDVIQLFSVVRDFNFQDEMILLIQLFMAHSNNQLPEFKDNKTIPNWSA